MNFGAGLRDHVISRLLGESWLSSWGDTCGEAHVEIGTIVDKIQSLDGVSRVEPRKRTEDPRLQSLGSRRISKSHMSVQTTIPGYSLQQQASPGPSALGALYETRVSSTQSGPPKHHICSLTLLHLRDHGIQLQRQRQIGASGSLQSEALLGHPRCNRGLSHFWL